MSRKPEIQYIGQFYIHGSEAKKLETKTLPKKPKTRLPMAKLEKLQKVYIDPVAICGIAVAVVMLVVMVFSAVQIGNAWTQYEVMANRVSALRQENARLEQNYRSSYDLEEVRTAALTLGMVPASELQTMSITVTMPEPEPETTLWDDIVWFMEGLFE